MHQKQSSPHTSAWLVRQLDQSLPLPELRDSQQQPTSTTPPTEQLPADVAPEQAAPPACQLAAGKELAKTLQQALGMAGRPSAVP